MKNKMLIKVTALLMSILSLFCAASCSSDVSAATVDLLDRITRNEVKSRPLDDEFKLKQTEFSLKLFNELYKSDENLLISPLSVAMTLGMTANGASSTTLSELEALLCNGFSLAELNGYYRTMLNRIEGDKNAQFKVADSVWFRDCERFTPKTEFLQTVADWYGASAFKAPFDDSTADDINNWVKENTDGMIEKTVDGISDRTMMYLINAVAFNAEWETSFAPADKALFTSSDNRSSLVSMMKGSESIYLSDDSASGFVKKYKGGRYAFAAIMPSDGVTLDAYLGSLTAEKLSGILNGATLSDVNVIMPKFSYDCETEMKNALSAFIPTAFDPDNADFKNMADCSENIYIYDVVHKTHIDVNENGTEASASTKVEISVKTSLTEQKNLVFNKPFIYMIIDTTNNIPVFFGAVNAL